jgi:hypothetical protein
MVCGDHLLGSRDAGQPHSGVAAEREVGAGGASGVGNPGVDLLRPRPARWPSESADTG